MLLLYISISWKQEHRARFSTGSVLKMWGLEDSSSKGIVLLAKLFTRDIIPGFIRSTEKCFPIISGTWNKYQTISGFTAGMKANRAIEHVRSHIQSGSREITLVTAATDFIFYNTGDRRPYERPILPLMIAICSQPLPPWAFILVSDSIEFSPREATENYWNTDTSNTKILMCRIVFLA